MEFFFLFIGLGFFLFVIWLVVNTEERDYNRRLNERREFGYEDAKRREREEFR